MLDTKRTFEIKIRSCWTVFEILLMFCMETRLSNIFKTTNVTYLTKVILERSYKVLQVTSKWKTLKRSLFCKDC